MTSKDREKAFDKIQYLLIKKKKRHEKERKGTIIGKKIIHLSLFLHVMITFPENLKKL